MYISHMAFVQLIIELSTLFAKFSFVRILRTHLAQTRFMLRSLDKISCTVVFKTPNHIYLQFLDLLVYSYQMCMRETGQ